MNSKVSRTLRRHFTIAALCAFVITAANLPASTAHPAPATESDPFHEVHHHVVHKRFKLAAEKARVLAVKGHPKAQTVLGLLYQHGLGVEKSIATAVYWLEKAAEQDLKEAENHLGHLFLEGKFIEKDLEKAEKWLLKAAKHGELEAQVHLGMMYLDEKSIKKDVRHAEIWLRAAALRDSEEAKKALEKIPGVKLVEEKTSQSRKAYSDGLYTMKDSWAGYGEIVKSVGAAAGGASGAP